MHVFTVGGDNIPPAGKRADSQTFDWTAKTSPRGSSRTGSNGIGIFALCYDLPGVLAAGVMHGNQSCRKWHGLTAGQHHVSKAEAQLDFVFESGQGFPIFRFSYFTFNAGAYGNNHRAVIGPHSITNCRRKTIARS